MTKPGAGRPAEEQVKPLIENVCSPTESTAASASHSRRSFLGGIGTLGAALALPSALNAEIAVHETTAAAPTRTYTNPLGIEIADPSILRAPDGKYYLYGTGGSGIGPFSPPDSRKDDNTAFPAFVSSNLVDWKPLGNVHRRNLADAWCIGAFWAPAVYFHGGKYYLFYSAQSGINPTNEYENFKVGVAVSDSPAGPFHDLYNRPIFEPGYPIIDADVLFDSDGRVYLYYSRCCYKHSIESELADWAKKAGWYKEIEESWVYGVELKPDFSGTIGEPVALLRPPVSFAQYHEAWENTSVLSHAVNRRWTEGPCSFRHGDMYYLMYAANAFSGPDYALGYAIAEHPLGPFTKALNNPVAAKNTDRGGTVIAPAHNCVTQSPDGKEMYCLYGARLNTRKDYPRTLFLCRMEIKQDGLLFVEPPDTDLVHPYPSGA